MTNTSKSLPPLSLATTMTRRSATRALIGAGAALFAATKAGSITLAQTSTGKSVTTAALNMRTGPSTRYAIVRVVPKGASVTVYNKGSAGYILAAYAGSTGYVLGAYLSAGGTTPDPVISGTARTTSAVNLRSGPSTSNQVLRVVAAGATVQISGTVKNGFRYVVHNGLSGWIADQYLSQSSDDQGGNSKTTTTALNLRAEPSTSARILTIMPAGARVQLLHTAANGFANVNYNGKQGWAHLDYLK